MNYLWLELLQDSHCWRLWDPGLAPASPGSDCCPSPPSSSSESSASSHEELLHCWSLLVTRDHPSSPLTPLTTHWTVWINLLITLIHFLHSKMERVWLSLSGGRLILFIWNRKSIVILGFTFSYFTLFTPSFTHSERWAQFELLQHQHLFIQWSHKVNLKDCMIHCFENWLLAEIFQET